MQVYESEHPSADKKEECTLIEIPDCDVLKVQFDPETCLEKNYDYIKLCKSKENVKSLENNYIQQDLIEYNQDSGITEGCFTGLKNERNNQPTEKNPLYISSTFSNNFQNLLNNKKSFNIDKIFFQIMVQIPVIFL